MSQDTNTMESFIKERYAGAIGYYWKASRDNKRWYKATRSLTVILGALVTLAASLASSQFVTESDFWNVVFAVGTPFLAAILTIAAGFSQSFQWGAAWKDMVMTAQRLEKERDRFLLTKSEERDYVKEAELINDFVLDESQGFFERMLGSVKVPTDKTDSQ